MLPYFGKNKLRHNLASRGPEKNQTEDRVPAFAGTTAWLSRAGNTTAPHVTGFSFRGCALRGMTVPGKKLINFYRLA